MVKRLLIITAIFFSLISINPLFSNPVIHIQPYIVETQFSEIYGGDTFIVENDKIYRNSSGLIFRERFDFLNKSIWYPISGEWRTVGYLYTESVSDRWNIIFLNLSLTYGVYEFKIYSNQPIMLGGGIVYGNLSSDPLHEENNIFSIIASIDSSFFYNPPPGGISNIIPPRDKWITCRVKYYRDLLNKSRYSAYTYIDNTWRNIVEDELTSSIKGFLRLMAYGLGEARFDELIVYRSTSIKIYGVVEGAVIQLFDENNVLKMSMIAESDIAEIDLAKFSFPLYGWKIKIIFPPYIQYNVDGTVFYKGVNSTIYMFDEDRFQAIYSTEIYVSDKYNISWIVPRDALIINLTIVGREEKYVYLNFDTYPMGFFKKIIFTNVNGSGTLYLYAYLSNIIEKIDVKDIDTDTHNPSDVNPGDLLNIKIYVRDRYTWLKDTYILIEVLNKSNNVLVKTLNTTTDLNGVGEVSFKAPLHSFKINIYANYTSNYVRLVGFNQTSFKIKSLIFLEAPSIISPLKSFKIFVHLFTSMYDLCGKKIVLQKWSRDGWINITSAETNSSGIAEINMALEKTGIHEFRAVFPGDEDFSPCISSIISINVLKKTILNLTGPANYPRGRKFKLNVYLTSNQNPIPNRLIEFYRSRDLVSWIKVGENTTDVNGYTFLEIVEKSIGIFYYKAVFKGDIEYQSAESNVLIVNIVSTPTKIIFLPPSFSNVTISFSLKARLIDDLNNSVPGRIIIFMKKVGDTWMEIGRNTTDSNGYTCIEVHEDSFGTYCYMAVFEGDNIYGRAVSKKIFIPIYRLSTRITVFLSTSKIFVDKPFKIIALLKYVNDTVIKDKPIEFYGLNNKLIGVSYTNISGYALTTYSIPLSGNFTLKIVFKGDNVRDNCTKEITISVYKIPTFLVLSGPAICMEDEIFTLRCVLRDIFGNPINGREIFFEKKIDGGWKIIGTNISLNGEVHLNIVEKDFGQYTYRAVFKGDEKYEASISNQINVSINIGFKKLLLIILIIMFVILFGIGIYRWRRKHLHEPAGSR